MNDFIVKKITNSSKRKSLFHFTRARNLPSISHVDALYSCNQANPHLSDERREVRREIQFHGHVFVANAHLKIADQVMDANTTHLEFHKYVDKHVFFWPTHLDCQKMLAIYSKREPNEVFAILQLDAQSLMTDFYDMIKLTKYDSGSSPRYPARTSYKKSLQMFLPIDQFEIVKRNDVPSKPSEIREVLVEGKVTNVTHYLQTVYCDNRSWINENWRKYTQSLQGF
ncbi:hypothetical protein PAECIP111891_02439 [Paenibacillus allorhizoplanae]|uniref:DUF4433 domain-containing protein n=1 Tax=Paenibacillus allorhizoplanae TaxID=2905648 RepID=A0ABM9C5H6_9BACL|nr:hypothetical protein [Paenibacillus allorhizoplanae]CAH1203826.1 hypothetical protein PAECIP111891_02439 [Paenibacillus allorhizoplanae]